MYRKKTIHATDLIKCKKRIKQLTHIHAYQGTKQLLTYVILSSIQGH